MAMVIGPTPPGTGVMWRGALGGGGELHVAHQLAAREPVDAHVDDHRARLHPGALDQLRHAHRRHQDVAPGRPPRAGRSCGGRSVTVASALSSRSAIGRAHQDAPAHHHRPLPGGLAADLLQHPHHAPGGAGDGAPRRPWPAARRSSGGGRRRPSPGGGRRSRVSESTCFGTGSCTRMPCTAGSALSASSRAWTSAWLAVSGKWCSLESKPTSARRLLLAGDVDLARRILAHPDDRQPGDARRCVAFSSRVPWATSCLTSSAIALPSMSVAAMAAHTTSSRAIEKARRSTPDAWPCVASCRHGARAHRPAHPRRRRGGAPRPLVASPTSRASSCR